MPDLTLGQKTEEMQERIKEMEEEVAEAFRRWNP